MTKTTRTDHQNQKPQDEQGPGLLPTEGQAGSERKNPTGVDSPNRRKSQEDGAPSPMRLERKTTTEL